MAVRASTAGAMVAVAVAIATGCSAPGGSPTRSAPATSVSCRTSAFGAISDSAAFDAANPGISPRPVPTIPHLAAVKRARLPGQAGSDAGVSLFADPGNARYIYELGPRGLSKIDAVAWRV